MHFGKFVLFGLSSISAAQAAPGIASFFNSLTSAVADDVSSLASAASAAAAQSVVTVLASDSNGIYKLLVSESGKEFTVVTTAAGPAITLAGPELLGSVTTTFAGSTYTIATALPVVTAPTGSPTSTARSGVPGPASPATTMGFITVLVGVCVGALIAV
ncbi:unnamed protein product [Mycena citricolor]|uniref:Uncharacterized protein n=1 Tax=Mycena citricolor TaxID=2018698 RepID=A0AAD2H6E5_9AGAR|nr:unnamed protein product [Mycena citricolor]